ncbi:metallophosphoesterase [Tundrisphaera sp. TA3]|uniref:metallophosphoesterase family protein n=1 Tax=Tundrisphaera sp. TA3 TaxID=3435775 RepID=UPI003EBD1BCD
MNRRRLLQNAGLVGLGPAMAPSLLAAADPAPVGEAPAVYAPTETGATVIWPVAVPSLGWVEYGEVGVEAEGKGRIERGDGFGSIPHGDHAIRVRLRDLRPGGKYWYRTHTRPIPGTPRPPEGFGVRVGKTYRLGLLDPGAKSTRFAIWNDTHDHPETLAKLGEMTRAEPWDFLFWNGDVSNNINTESMIPGLYLQPRGGLDLAQGPAILFNRGNHDVRGLAANRLPGYVDYPHGRPYYSFRSGPVGAVVLDTGEDKPDDHPSFLGMVDFANLIREQARWLAEEIEKPHLKDAPYRVAFCHIPLRWKDESTPNYALTGFDHFSLRGRQAWHDALVRWGAQIIVSGHTHSSHHMPATAEFPYQQLIGGGPKLDTNARLIRVEADDRALNFRVVALKDGRETLTASLKPLA